ncbi:MAG: fructose 1,6-bisphosphate aldolase/phosphatase [Methanofollis sp.]|nr:fructose 1,6-bisphosphate aldolase/phosphatase [Methanofollis sp.]
MITLTVLTADFGGYPAGLRAHPLVVEKAAKLLRAGHGTRIIDSFTTRAGGRLACVITSADRAGAAAVCDDLCAACGRVAAEIGLSGSGGVETIGFTFEERAGEAVLVFLSAGAAPNVWSIPICRIFADPFTAPALVRDPEMRRGFGFSCDDGAIFATPAETCSLLSHLDGGHMPVRVERQDRLPAAAAGVGSDPALVLRVGDGFPVVREALAVAAGNGLIPVSLCNMNPICPKAACLGFGIHDGMLIGPADLYDDPIFDS